MRRASGLKEFKNQKVQNLNGQKNGILSTGNGYPKRTSTTTPITTPKKAINLEESEKVEGQSGDKSEDKTKEKIHLSLKENLKNQTGQSR